MHDRSKAKGWREEGTYVEEFKQAKDPKESKQEKDPPPEKFFQLSSVPYSAIGAYEAKRAKERNREADLP